MQWRTLGSFTPTQLADARLQAHHALQLLTRFARGYHAPAEDDSHTNVGWDAEERAFAGRPVEGMQMALRLEDLALLWRNVNTRDQLAFPLDKRTIDEAIDWVNERLRDAGFALEPYEQPLHFEVPQHSVDAGGPFMVTEPEAFAELARCYGNAHLVLTDLHLRHPESTEVRCWPHHFDIATLLQLGGDRSIGCGMSPGDQWYHQPYFYTNRWPYPDPSSLPEPAPLSRWHTDTWTGAVLLLEDVAREKKDRQESLVRHFFDQTVAGLRRVFR